jgi:putative ABC transport system substrate-binding protein
MKRREFITFLGGTAVAWPMAARAQQPGGPKRIGLLAPFSDDQDPLVQQYLSAFKQRLHELGWIEPRNIRIDFRFTGQNADRIRTGAEELIALSPNLIVVWANPAVAILRNATESIPIVFVTVSDPVGSGFVTNLARPGKNITGFENFQPAIGGKWLEVLKDIAPEVRRIAFVHSQNIAAHVGFLRAAETASTSRGITVISADVRSAAQIESAIMAFAEQPNGGLIIAPSPFNTTHQDLIISLAARMRLPAIYPFRYFPANGGLVSYGFDTVAQHRAAAAYVDRILKGEKPGDLPVQAPSKYDLVINLKAAKALGLTISRDLQLTADEVIE